MLVPGEIAGVLRQPPPLALGFAGPSTLGFTTETLMMTIAGIEKEQLAWDKTFPQSDKVIHQKVSFNNRLGINLVADLYIPNNLDRSKKHPAIVVGGPYGAVKEQSSGRTRARADGRVRRPFGSGVRWNS
jgi:hypothetical protein